MDPNAASLALQYAQQRGVKPWRDPATGLDRYVICGWPEDLPLPGGCVRVEELIAAGVEFNAAFLAAIGIAP